MRNNYFEIQKKEGRRRKRLFHYMLSIQQNLSWAAAMPPSGVIVDLTPRVPSPREDTNKNNWNKIFLSLEQLYLLRIHTRKEEEVCFFFFFDLTQSCSTHTNDYYKRILRDSVYLTSMLLVSVQLSLLCCLHSVSELLMGEVDSSTLLSLLPTEKSRVSEPSSQSCPLCFTGLPWKIYLKYTFSKDVRSVITTHKVHHSAFSWINVGGRGGIPLLMMTWVCW